MQRDHQKLVVILLISLFVLLGCSDFSRYSLPDVSSHYKKEVALIVAKPTTAMDLTLIREITENLEKDLPTFSHFSKIVSDTQIRSQFERNLQLPVILSQYIQTFTLTGVSDKNFSVKLGQMFNVEQLLIAQFNQYPCDECDGKRSLIAKFNLLDAKTGMVIWRGSVNKSLELEDVERENFHMIVLATSDLILNELKKTFIIPWHQRRQENLKKL